MIKRELVLRLVKEHKLKGAEVSEKLDITKGSVTQYLQGKRASDSGKLNKVSAVKSGIDILAKDLAKKKVNEKEIIRRFCLVCKTAQKKVKV
jgi:predicted transcriptional regulator